MFEKLYELEKLVNDFVIDELRAREVSPDADPYNVACWLDANGSPRHVVDAFGADNLLDYIDEDNTAADFIERAIGAGYDASELLDELVVACGAYDVIEATMSATSSGEVLDFIGDDELLHCVASRFEPNDVVKFTH